MSYTFIRHKEPDTKELIEKALNKIKRSGLRMTANEIGESLLRKWARKVLNN